MTKSELFKRAWTIAKEAAVNFGGSSKSYFSESLKLAWEENKEMDYTLESIFKILVSKSEGGEKFNQWEGYGKKRIYVETQRQYGNYRKAGFFEIKENEIIDNSESADGAWNLRQAGYKVN